MILSDEEIRSDWLYEYTIDIAASHLEANSRIRFLEDTSSREFWAASRKIAELQDRADRLAVIADALAGELDKTYTAADIYDAWKCCQYNQIEADVAKAKLRELAEAAEWRDECNNLYTEMHIDWINGRPEGPHIYSIYEIYEEAEIAYEKALAAAKER
jgi:hypothetical protein